MKLERGQDSRVEFTFSATIISGKEGRAVLPCALLLITRVDITHICCGCCEFDELLRPPCLALC